MITLSFKNTDDATLEGPHTLYLKSITLGSSMKNDFIIEAPSVRSRHIVIAEKNETLWVSSMDDRVSYSVNSKKILGTKKLRIGDQIKIGDIEISLINFTPGQKREKDDFYSKYEDLVAKDPEIESILKKLESEILVIEKESHEQ